MVSDKTRRQLPIEWRVAGTVAWFSTVGRPISLPDLQRLILKEPAERNEIEKAISRLGTKLHERDGRYWVRGTTVRHPTPRTDRAYRYKWWRVKTAVRLLQRLPFIRMVAVANTLADRTAKPESDVDIFIVAKPGRLYLVRTLTVLTLQLHGLRRHGRKISNRICLTFYATEDHLDLSDITFEPYDIYVAYWISELVPVLDNQDTFEKFLKANAWVREFNPAYDSRSWEPLSSGRVARWWERMLGGKAGDWLEARWAGFWKRRIDTGPRQEEPDVQIIADDTMLKFHEKERRKVYRTEWELLMRTLGFDPKHITK